MRHFGHAAARVPFRVFITFVVFTLGLVAITLLFGGCEPATKHRVLRFFFDGIPPLDASTPENGVAVGKKTEARSATFTHKPFQEHTCDACHGSAQTQLVDTSSALCFQCHEDNQTTGSVVHAPVTEGECLACHSPHRSNFQYLLAMSPGELCWSCHKQTDETKAQFHGATGEQGCATCHDPHSSDSPILLRSADGEPVCFNCHDFFEPTPLIVHAPVAKGDCQICHAPHGSPIGPNLTEQLPMLCWQCHDEERIARTDVHKEANIENVACTECHFVHSSQNALLLK